MEEFSGLIFILVFIAFSILEGIGRKRKAQERKGGAEGTSPTPPVGAGRAPEAPARKTAGGEGGSSEGLIPKDVWEEILGLARGAPPPSSKPEPGPVPDPSSAPRPPREAETLEEIPPFEARSLEPLYVEHERVSQRSRDVEVATGTRAPEALTSRDRRGAGGGKGRGAAVLEMGQAPGPMAAHRRRIGGRRLRKELFGRGSPEELRKAVVLSEVLGPPVAMRDQPGETGEG